MVPLGTFLSCSARPGWPPLQHAKITYLFGHFRNVITLRGIREKLNNINKLLYLSVLHEVKPQHIFGCSVILLPVRVFIYTCWHLIVYYPPELRHQQSPATDLHMLQTTDAICTGRHIRSQMEIGSEE
jgi:hypothetical protein